MYATGLGVSSNQAKVKMIWCNRVKRYTCYSLLYYKICSSLVITELCVCCTWWGPICSACNGIPLVNCIFTFWIVIISTFRVIDQWWESVLFEAVKVHYRTIIKRLRKVHCMWIRLLRLTYSIVEIVVGEKFCQRFILCINICNSMLSVVFGINCMSVLVEGAV